MSRPLFRRKAYDTLKEWKERSKGSTAILVEGAKGVGKTTLVEEFAENEYTSGIIIDFSRASNDVKRLFNDLDDQDELFRGLQLYFDAMLVPRESVIVFDEVQYFPRAREAIKALVHDGRFDYIETGSFVSVKKNVKDIIIPSEEEKMTLHPLDFEEFLWAKGNNTFPLLRTYYEKRVKLNDSVHDHMMRLFREYTAVGGMPLAVLSYLDGCGYREIDEVKRNIIRMHLDELGRIDHSGKLERLYLAIPSQLSSQSTRYRINEAIPNGRLKRERRRFFELEDSHVVETCRHLHDLRAEPATSADQDFFRLYLEDTGLFVTLCFLDRQFSENPIYTLLVSGRPSADLDRVYRNAVAQSFAATGSNIYYHTFRKDGDPKHSYSIDFAMKVGEKVRPIEVRSTRVGEHRSLDALMSRKDLKLETPVVISPGNLDFRDGILYLPIYMTQFLDGKDHVQSDGDVSEHRL